MAASWDYIVIGAGHNGLAAACTLAMAGRSVLVVEQRAMAGGLSVSQPFVAAAPNHILSVGAMDDAMVAPGPLCDFFKLREHGYRPIHLQAPYGWMSEDGDTLLLHADFKRAVEEIRYFSPKDARTYIDLRATLDFLMGAMEDNMRQHPAHPSKLDLGKRLFALAADRTIRKTLGRMLSVSAFEMVAETFESDAMRGLWAYWMGMSSPATELATGVTLCSLAGVHRAGVFRPRGGMSGLIRAFEQCLAAHGGEIRLNHKVEQLLMSGKRVDGVRIVGGEELHARHGVLANCAPQIALGQLLPEAAQTHALKEKLGFIPANAIGVAPFKIDIAVGGRLGYPKAEARRKQRDDMDVRKTTFMTGTLEQHLAQYKACLRGEQVGFAPPLYFSILSANDDSLAPPGEDVFYLYANVPLAPVGGWDACQPKYSAQIMNTVARYVGGLEMEIGRIETTPQDFEKDYGAPNGSYYHVDMLPTRMGMNRPAPDLGGYKTPIAGLYLAGAGSHPSGGVCGWAGRHAARTALEQE